jgi:NTP pyrophosphatase (non-canonical NTP hydrolase)
MDYFQKIKLIAKALNKKYPKGDEPFQIITRLCEEAGELAKEVNHFEDTGKKIEKYGPPDKNKLAKEVQDIFRSAWHIAIHYGVEKELIDSIDESLKKLKEDGFIKDDEK